MIEAESVYCAARAESLTVIQGEFRFWAPGGAEPQDGLAGCP
jgi:hypothetical protein